MMRRPLKLLLVCHANVCRSPMAERVFRHVLNDVMEAEVSSAGLAAMSGSPIHPLAREVLGARGYDRPGDTNAMRLVKPMLDWADVVLTMESGQRLEIIRRFPLAALNVWTLGHWIDREIDDPVGGDRARFESSLDLIEQCARSWLPVLTQQPTL
ncbi:low molecular weight phosphotyrosine protein phosphatase [Paraburkholderia kururiensis]|uniref:protein-tyrosine-phosphatase n=1 Tax=Paraburkholderia kururiensis TaxID=984307 RepID=A0ABZ0WHB8_9BURK|nr:low molecular weight phosphotyrosine protein phosphatase [Paraburkholderia kururiensis]WQD76749.1 hypothetical protein U0042_22075 [Paraburkholderia kururiensis]